MDDKPVEDWPTPMSDATGATDVTETGEIRTYSATMTFTVNSAGAGSKVFTFDLFYDVHFVTAHPCVPSRHSSILTSPTSPSFQIPSPPQQSDKTKLGPHELYFGVYCDHVS